MITPNNNSNTQYRKSKTKNLPITHRIGEKKNVSLISEPNLNPRRSDSAEVKITESDNESSGIGKLGSR